MMRMTLTMTMTITMMMMMMMMMIDAFDSQDHLVHPCLFIGCFVWVVLYEQGMNKGTLRAFLTWCFYHEFSRSMGASGRSGGNRGRTWFFTSHLLPGVRQKRIEWPSMQIMKPLLVTCMNNSGGTGSLKATSSFLVGL